MNGAVDFANAYVVFQTNSIHEGHGVVSPFTDRFGKARLMIASVDLYNWPWQRACMQSDRHAGAPSRQPLFELTNFKHG